MGQKADVAHVGWYCANYHELSQREWEGEHFVFNPLSGDTHLLNALSMEILRLLHGEGGRALDDVVTRLMAETPDVEEQQLRHTIGLHLVQLEAMGLVNFHRHEADTPTSKRA